MDDKITQFLDKFLKLDLEFVSHVFAGEIGDVLKIKNVNYPFIFPDRFPISTIYNYFIYFDSNTYIIINNVEDERRIKEKIKLIEDLQSKIEQELKEDKINKALDEFINNN